MSDEAVMPFEDGRAISPAVFPEGLIDGLVLAATAMGDSGGAAVKAGLAPGLARAVGARLDALDALERAARHAAVKRIVETLAHVPSDLDAPPRVLRVLAADVPRAVGRAWEKASPPVRRGFKTTRSLKTVLRRISHARDASARARELEMVRRAAWRG